MSGAEYDICVIGGGAAGLVVAAGAAALGARVALVERARLGGDCLYHGCVPSKALLKTAKVASVMRDAARFGLAPAHPAPDIGRVMERVRAVIGALEPHDSPERFRGLGVEVIVGSGRFLSRSRFALAGRVIGARRFVIATGSRPAVPQLPGIDSVPYLTNETVFALSEPIPHLLVLGGGPIGAELAQAFARLGSRVTLVETQARLLPAEDMDLAAVVAAALQRDGVELCLGSTARQLSGAAGAIRCEVESTHGSRRTLAGTHLLFATGRAANVEDLGLEAAGVALRQGRILTDRRLRTSARHIYACGDVTGPYLFTHTAEHQAGVVLRNALFHLPAKVEERAIPWCIFTDPELARTGLSETEARQQGIDHCVYTFPFSDIDRAQTDGESAGFAKIVTTPAGRLLGAGLVGPSAGELIQEYTLAIAHGMKAADIARTIHVYPTLAQINRRVADQRMKGQLTPRARKWIKRVFGLRG